MAVLLLSHLVVLQGDGDYEIVPDLVIDEALRARMKKVRGGQVTSLP